MEHWGEAQRLLTGIPSGILGLDFLTLGFQKGDLILLAARTTMGKTALSIQMAMHAAKEGTRVLYVSLEMADQAIVGRMHSHESRIDSMRLRQGGLPNEFLDRAGEAMGRLSSLPIHIWETYRLTPARLLAAIRAVKGGIDLLVLDYVQLMVDDEHHDRLHEEIGSISKKLKSMAMEMGFAALVLAQLRRPPQGSEGRRPYLSDLKDSGALEQDADVVLFIHGNPHAQGKERDHVEVFLEKQRNGPVGSVDLNFRREIGEFK